MGSMVSARLGVRRWGVRAAGASGLAALLVVSGAVTAYAAGLPAGATATGLTGSRTSATRLSFPISDRTVATVDVGSGNANISSTLLQLPGVAGQVPIGVAFNSRDTTGGSPTGSLKGPGPGWTWGLAGAGSLSANGSTINYTTADGAIWPFTLSGSLYTSPAGLKAMLTKQSDTSWLLMFLESGTKIVFNANGDPTSVTDRNSNTVAISPWSGSTASVTSTAGPTAARTATLQWAASGSGGSTTVSQASGTSTRSASLAQAANGSVLSFTDPAGGATAFAYGSNGLVSQITGPTGAKTSFSYDSSRRVTQVTRMNGTVFSAGDSVTRLAYSSSTQTLVADPNTSQSSAVAAVPRTTYTLNSGLLVTKAVDAAGREQSRTYSPKGLDTATSTTGASGASGSVTSTYSYRDTLNGGLSPETAKSQGGNTSAATYASSGAAQYLPKTTASDSNISGGTNTTQYDYDTAGNPTGVTGNTVAGAGTTATSTQVTSTLTRNSDGTVASAAAPGNGSNTTTYEYVNRQLSKVIPVSGSSLASTQYSYDDYGRLKTVADGNGKTTTYSYDADDRTTSTAFSDGTQTVANTWDKTGNLTQQVSAGGTITNSYDDLGQLRETGNSAAGGTVAYNYDKGGNNTSITDTRGTTKQTFDASGVLLTTSYPKSLSTAPNGSGFATTYFRTNSNGNRTDTWLQGQTPTNNVPTDWAARVQTAYAANGRVARITAKKGDPASETTVMDVYYCYNTAGATTSCGTATTTDASKLQWTYNAVTSQTTKFTYDGLGRLTRVVESGGSKGNSTYAYTYDSRGNRLTANVTGSKTSSQTLAYNAANQITTSGYSYDGAGNMTASPNASYTYNAAEQMTSATVNSTQYNYTYAGATQNAVLSQTGGGKAYNVVYGRPDSNGNPTIAQYKVDSNTAYVEQDPNTGQATMLHTSTDIAALYIYDGLGSPVALLTDFSSTAAQYSYDPYGLPTLETTAGGNGVGQNPYAFKSGIQDRFTGFVKYGARWYNPTTGTWTQQDTLDSPLDASNANRYSFAGGDPVNGSDPTGRISKTVLCVLAIVGTVVAGVRAAALIPAGIAAVGAAPVTGGTSAILAFALGIEFGADTAAALFGLVSAIRLCT